MKKEIKIIYTMRFFDDLEQFTDSDELFSLVKEKATLLKQFPLIGPQIARGFRKIIFEYQSQQYIFSYKFLTSEKKIKIYRFKKSRQNHFHSSEK